MKLLNDYLKGELRMYSLVMYNISPIQQGIQHSHSVAEFSRVNTESHKALYKRWADDHKTVILLNGGTSNDGKFAYNPANGLHDFSNEGQKGSMEIHRDQLINWNYPHACFYEPDLNYSLTSISFIVGEETFDSKPLTPADGEYFDMWSTNTKTAEQLNKVRADWFLGQDFNKWCKQFRLA